MEVPGVQQNLEVLIAFLFKELQKGKDQTP